MCIRARVVPAAAAAPTAVYDYDQLTVPKEELPPGVDPTQRELFLDDFQFEYHFLCTKEEFSKLAKWKRTQMKKQVGLF